MVVKTLKELLDGQDWQTLDKLSARLQELDKNYMAYLDAVKVGYITGVEINEPYSDLSIKDILKNKGKSHMNSIIKSALGTEDNKEKEVYISERLTVYLAGPYTPYDASPHSAPKVAHENVVRAIDFGIDVADRGHFPFIPHYSHFMHIYGKKEMPYEFYTEQDFKWLEKCDAIFYYKDKIGEMKRGLTGAERELQEAIKQRKLVFFSVEEIPKYVGVKS
ncbi:hypothetical protein IG206_00845 [Candidatus Parvarchaeota archaeon]|nr:hypothetical protein [Candidatus Acidifodinimicrobium mancum]